MSGLDTRGDNTAIVWWLLICCATIFAMVVLGGVTRLTGSGLSMVEWAPIMGVLPPMGQAEWEAAFELYKQYPEYQLKNFDFGLAEFKSIFWFEYAHRVLGRGIGVLFALPFLYFLIRGLIHRSLVPKMILLFVLGGLQGLMGWYMVKSGLVDVPHVSQYRLTAHLLLAIVIYAYMLWLVLDLQYPGGGSPGTHSRRAVQASWLTGFVLLTIISGGFVAGLKAGFTFNTFPLMGGQWIPDNVLILEPAWRNLFENIATVQFNHRVLAITLALVLCGFWYLTRGEVRTPRLRLGLNLMLLAVVLQVALGISTLLLVVPVALAAAHQAGALVLLSAMLFLTHQLRRA